MATRCNRLALIAKSSSDLEPPSPMVLAEEDYVGSSLEVDGASQWLTRVWRAH